MMPFIRLPSKAATLFATARDLLVADIYVVTGTFPRDERFGLVSQMRRSAVSVPSNIAEGAARSSKKEFANFLSVARGSAYNPSPLLTSCERMGLMPEAADLTSKIERIFAMLNAMITRFR